MSTIGERLGRAISHREISISELFRGVRERLRGPGKGAPQTAAPPAYATVHRYVTGKSIPSLGFLEAAADVLDVRLAWLVAEDGEMTVAAERDRHRREGTVRLVRRKEAEMGLRRGFPPYDLLAMPTKNWLLQAWLVQTARLVVPGSDWLRAFLDPERAEHRGYVIGRYVLAGFRTCGVDPRQMDPIALNNVVGAIATGLTQMTTSNQSRKDLKTHAEGIEAIWNQVVDQAAGFSISLTEPGPATDSLE